MSCTRDIMGVMVCITLFVWCSLFKFMMDTIRLLRCKCKQSLLML